MARWDTTQVSQAAMTAISGWVATGGRAVFTAGAAQLDEANQTNTVTRTLVPVLQTGLWTGTR